jgi:hypothetical protein
MPTVEEVGAKIRESIRAARTEGFAIKPKILRRRTERACCAVGAVVRNLPLDTPGWDAASRELGVGYYILVDVARGFDGETPASDLEWYGLGIRLREEVESGLL